MLVDRFGRTARDLRISLTDRCGLRCQYCMPAEGMPWMAGRDLLSDKELLRLAGVLVSAGITQIRLTGGEPLLRPGVAVIVSELKALTPAPRIALTTNGVALARTAAELAAAGLDRVNVSLDTLRPERFLAMTRRHVHHAVLEGLAAASHAGLHPVKVNAVLVRGVNDDEAVDLLEFCLTHGYHLRFIEQMPLDPQHSWDRGQLVTGEEIRRRLSERWTLAPHQYRGSAPAQLWSLDGGPATVGVIASVSEPFCANCDRLRLTADGQLRNCLFAHDETDLRDLLRNGANDVQLLRAIEAGVAGKKSGHGIDDPAFVQPRRPMSAIGG